MSVNFIFSKDSDETRNMHTKSNDIEIMVGSETREIIEELFKSLLQRYQEGLKESTKGSQFIFDSVNILHYHLQKTSLKRIGSSYIDSPEWLKNKKATKNPENNDDSYFQYALTAALNYLNIKSHPERVLNLKPFIDQYDWKEINSPLHKEDRKKCESNNNSIALNILFVPHNAKEIRLACKPKYNFKRENQVILLMITNGKKWHNLAVKSLSKFLRGITSNHTGDSYCLNCFHSYSTEKKILKNMKKYVIIMTIFM